MDFWWLKRPSSWNLQRNPLVPSVPLEGTDTVRGLSTLERMRTADLIVSNHDDTPKKENVGVRRRYQRYKGPFIEYLGLEDVKRDAKSWREFGGQESSKVPRGGVSFSIPASLDLLAERVDVRGPRNVGTKSMLHALLTLISCLQENIVYYFGNYLRLFLCILVLMTYLRPKSIVGIAVLGYNMYSNYEMALQLAICKHRAECSGRSPGACMIWKIFVIFFDCVIYPPKKIKIYVRREQNEKWYIGKISFKECHMHSYCTTFSNVDNFMVHSKKDWQMF